MAEKKKVLIIEDEIAFSKMVKIRLEAAVMGQLRVG